MKWLVCFDISDDKKRDKIASLLEEYGIRVQKSVFEIEINKTNLERLTEKVAKLIKKEDSIRFYFMQNDTIRKSFYFGFGSKPFFGEDIVIF